MVRKLKYHEHKLLKKVDFISWEADAKEVKNREIIRKYHIMKRDDLSKYTMLIKLIINIRGKIKAVDSPEFAKEMIAELKAKLYSLGIINGKLGGIDETNFCRRRLPAMMVKKQMVTKISEATKFVQQGHVRVGPEVVKDPAFLVTRPMEDFITWVDTSTIKRHVMEYNEMRDDYEMM